MPAAEFSVLYGISPDYSASVDLVRKENGDDFGALYAMKSVPLPAKKRVLQRERDVLCSIAEEPSDFIQTLHYAFLSISPDSAHLVTEIYPGGSLETFLDERNDLRFTDTEGRFYIAEVVCAVEFLHSRLIVHGDVKMANIFIKSNGHVVLGDFDCATMLESTQDVVTSVKGTAKYMAPEVPNESYSFPVDIWCIGMLAVDLMVTDPRSIDIEWPWDKVAGIVRQGFTLKPKIAARIPQKLKSFIFATVQKDPRNRPPIGELKKLRYLSVWYPKWENCVAKSKMPPPYVNQQRIFLQPRVFDGRIITESATADGWLTHFRSREDRGAELGLSSSPEREISCGER